MPRVICDSGKLLDHPGDSRQRPEVCFEAMLLRPKTQRGIYPAQFPRIKSWLASGAPGALEFRGTAFQKAGKPSAYALTANAQ